MARRPARRSHAGPCRAAGVSAGRPRRSSAADDRADRGRGRSLRPRDRRLRRTRRRPGRLRGVDLVDVECARPGAARLVAAVHDAGRRVVGSYHDVTATPGLDEMLDRLRAQAAAGADVCKIAVMPRVPADVARLLEACALAGAELAQPVIAMAMGPLGLASRLLGWDFGSAAGFASLGQDVSAPGQLPVDDLVQVVAAIDRLRRR
ncbi:type I 3-dehydroquinate dehydratase [Propionibacterium australiense]|nr:type I 3-dehydroquinate dehydratase [Propionibacterium australiense]